MAQKITILEYANTKGLTVYDVTQNAKEKGVILPEDPEYVLDDSQLNQIDPIFAHQNKYKQIMSGNNIDSNESAPKTLTSKNEKQPSENLRVLNKIDLIVLTFLFWLLCFDVFVNAYARHSGPRKLQLLLQHKKQRVCQNSLILKKSQSPDFHKPGLCYV